MSASPLPLLSNMRDGEPESTSLSVAAASAAQSGGGEGTNFISPITFDEHPENTVISNQYAQLGVVFTGSSPTIKSDIVSPSGLTLQISDGEIRGQFVLAGTSEPATVYQLKWDMGYLDEVGSVRMETFGPQGELLSSAVNTGTGFYRYTSRGGSIGIASWRFQVIGTEPAGFGIDNVSFSTPGEDDLGREQGITACSLGNPVNPAVGNKYQQETDYRGARVFPLVATRAYNSIDGNWQFFPEIRHQPSQIVAHVIQADGKVLSYTRAGQTSWGATGTEMTGELTSIVNGLGTVVGWRYTTLDDQTSQFDSIGRLVSVTQRSGVQHSYAYTPSSITVTHSLGGSLSYALNTAGTIIGFSDPQGNAYSYNYNGNGLLSGVSYPGSGASRSYLYEDSTSSDLLTGIVDGNGDRFATWAYDSNRRAILSEHNNGAERVTFDYSYTDHPLYPQTRVTNALGKQTTYHYITVNGARKVFRVSGHASASCVAANQNYGFDGRAFVASKTDWRGNRTNYQRNASGQELSRTEAAGSSVQRTVTTDWHPTFNVPVKITAPGRETTFTYDEKGNLLSRSVKDIGPP
jgi:YD repeat-containing protein